MLAKAIEDNATENLFARREEKINALPPRQRDEG